MVPGFVYRYRYKCQPHPLPWIKEQTCTMADPWSLRTVLIPNRDGGTQPCHPLQGSPCASGDSCCLLSVSHNSQALSLLWIVMLFISICCAGFFSLLIWCLVLYLTPWLLTYLVYVSAQMANKKTSDLWLLLLMLEVKLRFLPTFRLSCITHKKPARCEFCHLQLCHHYQSFSLQILN